MSPRQPRAARWLLSEQPRGDPSPAGVTATPAVPSRGRGTRGRSPPPGARGHPGAGAAWGTEAVPAALPGAALGGGSRQLRGHGARRAPRAWRGSAPALPFLPATVFTGSRGARACLPGGGRGGSGGACEGSSPASRFAQGTKTFEDSPPPPPLGARPARTSAPLAGATWHPQKVGSIPQELPFGGAGGLWTPLSPAPLSCLGPAPSGAPSSPVTAPVSPQPSPLRVTPRVAPPAACGHLPWAGQVCGGGGIMGPEPPPPTITPSRPQPGFCPVSPSTPPRWAPTRPRQSRVSSCRLLPLKTC